MFATQDKREHIKLVAGHNALEHSIVPVYDFTRGKAVDDLFSDFEPMDDLLCLWLFFFFKSLLSYVFHRFTLSFICSFNKFAFFTGCILYSLCCTHTWFHNVFRSFRFSHPSTGSPGTVYNHTVTYTMALGDDVS